MSWIPLTPFLRSALARCSVLGFGLAIAGLLALGLGGADAGAAAGRALETPDQYKTFVMNADGSGQTKVTRNEMEEYDPAWSPDGTKIAFSAFSGRSYARGQVFVMNADGSGRTRLTNNPLDNFGPTWSPDGTKIAFTRGATLHADIYVMNADGTGQRSLTNDPADDRLAAWSPDGTKIAFATNRNGPYEIFVMNADGSNETNLTAEIGLPAFEPTWSPNGTKIAFTSYLPGGGPSPELYVMNADGSVKTMLTRTPTVDEFDPAWSPNGAKIAFARSTFSGRSGLDTEIYVMNVDGSGIARLTNSALTSFGPAWSPDGTRIAFTRHTSCRVPRVVGRRLAAARRMIRSANCSVGPIRYKRSSRRRGTVLQQGWRPGTLLDAGNPIALVVSR